MPTQIFDRHSVGRKMKGSQKEEKRIDIRNENLFHTYAPFPLILSIRSGKGRRGRNFGEEGEERE